MYNYTEAEKRSSVLPSMLSMKVVEDFPSLIFLASPKILNTVVLAEGYNVITMANIRTGKMSGRTEWTTRSVATRERSGAVDRRNLCPWPLHTVSVHYTTKVDHNHHYFFTCIYIKTEYAKIAL